MTGYYTAGASQLNAVLTCRSFVVFTAAGQGHKEVIQWLVENGANMTITNTAGETPKDVARRFGSLGVLQVLGGDQGTTHGSHVTRTCV